MERTWNSRKKAICGFFCVTFLQIYEGEPLKRSKNCKKKSENLRFQKKWFFQYKSWIKNGPFLTIFLVRKMTKRKGFPEWVSPPFPMNFIRARSSEEFVGQNFDPPKIWPNLYWKWICPNIFHFYFFMPLLRELLFSTAILREKFTLFSVFSTALLRENFSTAFLRENFSSKKAKYL